MSNLTLTAAPYIHIYEWVLYFLVSYGIIGVVWVIILLQIKNQQFEEKITLNIIWNMKSNVSLEIKYLNHSIYTSSLDLRTES